MSMKKQQCVGKPLDDATLKYIEGDNKLALALCPVERHFLRSETKGRFKIDTSFARIDEDERRAHITRLLLKEVKRLKKLLHQK